MADQRELLLRKKELLEKRKQLLEQQEEPQYARGERSAVGNVFERPAASARATIQAQPLAAPLGPLAGLVGSTGLIGQKAQTGAIKGAVTPEEVPRFQEQALQKFVPQTQSTAINFLGGLPASTAGLAADIVTDPAAVLLSLLGKTPTGKGTTLGGRIAETKVGQAVGKVAQSEIAPLKAGKRFISRFQSDFINQNVYPKMEGLFNEKVNTFAKGVQSFAKRKLNMSDDVINHISKKTPAGIRKSRLSLNDSLDDVSLQIKAGFGEKLQGIQKTYEKAFSGLSDTDLINIDDAYNVMRKVLIKHQMIDKTGNLTTLGKDSATNAPFRNFIAFHEQFKPAAGTKGVGGVNKYVWQDLKNAIGDASIKDSRLTKEFTAISDALHNQAEKSGLSGIKEARQLFKTYMDNVNLTKGLQSEQQLKNIFSNPQKARELSQVDKYLNSNFTDSAKDIVAGRQLQKIDNIGIPSAAQPQTVLHQQLEKAVSPRSRKFVKQTFFEDLLGKDPRIDGLFKEIASFGRNQVIKKVGVGVGSTYIIYELLKKTLGKTMYGGDEENLGG